MFMRVRVKITMSKIPSTMYAMADDLNLSLFIVTMYGFIHMDHIGEAKYGSQECLRERETSLDGNLDERLQ
jgi:hypothetical protein